MFAVMTVLACCSSCAAEQRVTERAAATAADVVREVAHYGDQLYAVSVDRCHQAELVAAALPELEAARAAVGEIRSRCDDAFFALEQLRLAVNTADEWAAKLERGTTTVREATQAALRARDAFTYAQQAHQTLNEYLRRFESP